MARVTVAPSEGDDAVGGEIEMIVLLAMSLELEAHRQRAGSLVLPQQDRVRRNFRI
jgi:hypothetical protein